MMKISTHLSIAFRYFNRMKKNLGIVAFSMAIGIASFYLLIFFGEIVRQETARRFYSPGVDLFSVVKRNDAVRIAPAQIRLFDEKTAAYLKRNPQFVVGVAPELSTTDEIHYGELTIKVPVIGVEEGYLSVYGLRLEYGRFFTRFDSTKSYSVIGNRLYQRLKKTASDSLVGARIYIGQQLVENMGVLEASQSISSEYSIDDALLLPLATLKQFAIHPEISKITVRANPGQPIGQVVQYLDHSLQDYLGDISNFEVNNQRVFLSIISERVKNLSILWGALGIIAILIGSWGLLRIMCISILRRRMEVSYLQRFEAHDKSLLSQFLTEALIVTVITGILGIGFGIVFSVVISRLNNWMFFISFLGIATSFVVTLFINLIMGVYPVAVTLYSKKVKGKLEE
ncbi:MAG: hypothetical protein GWP06_10655 [Actinobacteria bacterium]|nr:hypothetical protein [Actinomycetota bacterium]